MSCNQLSLSRQKQVLLTLLRHLQPAEKQAEILFGKTTQQEKQLELQQSELKVNLKHIQEKDDLINDLREQLVSLKIAATSAQETAQSQMKSLNNVIATKEQSLLQLNELVKQFENELKQLKQTLSARELHVQQLENERSELQT